MALKRSSVRIRYAPLFPLPMTEHQFLSDSFFDNLNSNDFGGEFSDAQDLVSAAKASEAENKEFTSKTSLSFMVMGVLMMLVGVSAVFFQEIGTLFSIIGLAVSLPFLLQGLTYKPDESIKEKLQRFQKALSQGIRKPRAKQFVRSKNDRMIFGVFAGIARYLGIPVWILRLLAVSLLFVSGGLVLIFYFALAFSLPEEESLPELGD